MKNEFELAPWTIEGFEAQPDVRDVKGGETIYRAFGGTSKSLRNCFFTPAIGSAPMNCWTAELLEIELNASLWGNDFDRVQSFTMNRVAGAKYKIGNVAQSGYAGCDTGQLFYQRSWVTPSKIFKQVVFILDTGTSLETLVRAGQSFSIAPGRYHRTGNRSWQ